MVNKKVKEEEKYCVNCGKELNKEGYCYGIDCELKMRKGLNIKQTCD